MLSHANLRILLKTCLFSLGKTKMSDFRNLVNITSKTSVETWIILKDVRCWLKESGGKDTLGEDTFVEYRPLCGPQANTLFHENDFVISKIRHCSSLGRMLIKSVSVSIGGYEVGYDSEYYSMWRELEQTRSPTQQQTHVIDGSKKPKEQKRHPTKQQHAQQKNRKHTRKLCK